LVILGLGKKFITMKFSNIICLFLAIFFVSCQNNSNREQEYFKKQNFKGVIIEKYQDWDKHGLECVKLLNYNKEIVVLWLDNWRPDNIWDYVKVGDSLIKPLNHLAITIKREQEAPRKFRYKEAGL